MLKKEELIQTPEYWLESIQNELYKQVTAYIKREGINQSELAKRLGVSKGYISQILNGNFNYTLKKLIELSIAIEVIPNLRFISFKKGKTISKKTTRNAKIIPFDSSRNRKVA